VLLPVFVTAVETSGGMLLSQDMVPPFFQLPVHSDVTFVDAGRTDLIPKPVLHGLEISLLDWRKIIERRFVRTGLSEIEKSESLPSVERHVDFRSVRQAAAKARDQSRRIALTCEIQLCVVLTRSANLASEIGG